jgi:hypothetical protein
MSPALIGALVGLAFAVVEYFFFGVLIERAMKRGEKGAGPRIFDIVRKVQLIAFPIAGFLIGPLVVGTSGVE